MQLPHIECLVLEVTGLYSYSLALIYRPPNSNIVNFIESLSGILEQLNSNHNSPCYLFGDFNINLLHINQHISDFTNLLFSWSFFPTITKPTRVTTSSATLIDHIWSNDDNFLTSGIFHHTLSDHFPVFASFMPRHTDPSSLEPLRQYQKRMINVNSINSFKTSLADYKWRDEMTGDDVNVEFDTYIKSFLNLYNNHFPVKQFTIKEKHITKPYITAAIKTSIKQRNKLQKLSAKWPLTYLKLYKEYRNRLTNIIRAAKQNYHKLSLKDNAGCPAKTWKTINKILGKTSTHNSNLIFTENDNVITDSHAITLIIILLMWLTT